MDGSNTKKSNIQAFNCQFLASKTIPKAVWSRQLFTLWTLSKKSKIKCTKISALLKILQPSMIKKDLMPVVSDLIKKTTDLKAKIREVAIEFCLYLSHQSPIGPEVMVN